MRDALAVAWKEWREIAGQGGMQGRQGMLLFVAAFGVIMPLMNGRAWIASPIMAVAWAWVPMFLVSTIIADAFAGERERHTLETLLATRLSESSILLGKIGAALAYAGVLCGISLLLGVIVINLAHRGEGLLLYRPATLAAMAALGLLGAVFIGSIGAVISLRAATVRQAQQTLGGVILVLFVLPMAAVRMLPASWRTDAMASAATGAQAATLAIGLLVLIDIALVMFARARFRRGRIIAG